VTDFPTYLELLALFGVNVEAIKAEWLAWQALHPGEAIPLEELAAQLWAGLDDSKIKAWCDDGANELIAFVKNASGPISVGDDPSLMA